MYLLSTRVLEVLNDGKSARRVCVCEQAGLQLVEDADVEHHSLASVDNDTVPAGRSSVSFERSFCNTVYYCNLQCCTFIYCPCQCSLSLFKSPQASSTACVSVGCQFLTCCLTEPHNVLIYLV